MSNLVDFVHLHVHSEYSMLDGLGRIPALVTKAKQLDQKALALTDHGGMYGVIHFYNECQRQEIKPIVGVEAYVAHNSRIDKQIRMGADQFHITLLAENFEGYQNLMRLVSIANFEGFSYKPRIDFETLAKHADHVIATSGCMSSYFNRLLRDGKEKEAIAEFKKYKELLGDRFFIEVQVHPAIKEQVELTKQQIKIARQLDIKLVATNDVHYVEPTEAQAQDALLCVQTRKLISDTKRMTMFGSPDFYLRSSQEMAELFHELPEALTTTVEIAERCNLTIPTGKLMFPKYPLPKGETEVSYFKKMAQAGLKKKFKNVTSDLQKRLDYEMDVIVQKGYSTYFLITQDFVNWAKNQGIAVGPGRGSAAGSLVSYVLNITTVDPIQHGLAFERFLNPERPTPPDIDIDFADITRDKVINYVSEKYGYDHVAHVITFGRMEARVAIRDIGRVLGMPYEEPDKIAKLIPNDPGKKTSLKSALESVPELAEYNKQKKYHDLIELAQQVEGVIRHSSVHAAAIVVTDQPLTNYVPIQKDTKSGETLTQYDMYVLDCNVSDDAIGLLKFDFLGLRNLSIIQTALQLIKVNKNLSLDIDTIPLDDKKTFKLLSNGETMGVFQLESAGMRRVARTLKPSQFSDITAMVALYRPGPMELIPQFIEGKHNPKSIIYADETLQPILEETYGVMVYQEQILEIANVMAGYSLGEADILRRAIGKKKKKLLDENKRRFITQSVEKGYRQEVADRVWGFIEAFANYGFNKAHATSYAMIAYQTAYLKSNFPVEYMTALMSVESASHSANRDTKVAIAIETCKKMGIKVLPPEINISDQDFSTEKDGKSLQKLAVRFGFTAIKHLGSSAIDEILATRTRVKKFTSLTQFIHETDSRKVNKTTLECLIKVGAMDQFGTRASMLENLEKIRQTAGQLQSEVEGQDSLFKGVSKAASEMKDTFPTMSEYPKQELLSFERELLGLYLTDHPMAHALKAVNKRATKTISEIDQDIHRNDSFLFGGVVTSLRRVSTKKDNSLMAFGKLEDNSGSIDFVVFPRTYKEFGHLLTPDAVLLLKAKVDVRDEEVQLVVEKITAPDQDPAVNTQAIEADHEIFIPRDTTKETLTNLGKLLKSSPGDDSVVILIPNGSKPQRMLLPYGVNWTNELDTQVQKLLQ
ncbi:MAG: DNA polymerase III subunit alpha [Candidatus Pacebacteria bacterium CG_4_10_14_0_8_um_filter_43_12]|nr:MAG: DNA polymerase III subunit alpha [Candidatus Pacebacteria bacterium CG10_big_fil_rev_8_21_14_0_10_44_11]PIY79342.1 MAG: DNA polymerase III subunit alpha [Candidatus Pacebacteria bacterium CG_4_10_14_0_8_um_filter_43_12]